MGRNIWVVMIFSMQPLLLQDLARNRVMDISKESVTSIEIPQDSCTWKIVFGPVTQDWTECYPNAEEYIDENAEMNVDTAPITVFKDASHAFCLDTRRSVISI